MRPLRYLFPYEAYANQAKCMIDAHIEDIDEKRDGLFREFSDLFNKVINTDGCFIKSNNPLYTGDDDPGYNLVLDPNNELFFYEGV